MSLAGKTALVTGAARGIGFVISRVLCERGMRVVINDRDPEATEIAEQKLKQDRFEVAGLAADVTRPADVQNLFEAAEQRFGPLWLLVNNAGVFRAGSCETLPEQDWDETFAVDAKGVFLCSQAALRRMTMQRAGRIVVISSIAGWITRTNQIAYCAAKAAAIHFARCLAVEAAPHGITVNCICPGMTDSAMLRDTASARNVAIEDYLTMIPTGTLAEAEDHAHTVVWLASEEARHVTGQVISVDGGQSLYHPLTLRR